MLWTVNIGPTVPGPYTMVVHMEQRGLHAIRSKVRGRAHVAGHVLRKKSGASGQTGRVPVSFALSVPISRTLHAVRLS